MAEQITEAEVRALLAAEAQPVKPCPFCGVTPDLNNPYAFQSSQGDKWGALQCCGQGPEVRTGWEPVEKWRGDAIEAWNTRVVSIAPLASSWLAMREREAKLVAAVESHIHDLVKHYQPAPFMDGSRLVPPSIERLLQRLESALAAKETGRG